jgi:negative regulator of sigma-B (phosphoserine phosphatase)
MSRRSGDAAFLEWAVAGRPMPGEDVSGDVATVHAIGSRCVVAVVDGLGHGPEAADAANLAVEVIEKNRAEPLEALVLLTHEKLATSRGAAATVAIIDGERGQMEWVGVGNVNGLLVRADDTARPRTLGVFLCRGVLGYNLPTLHLSDPVSLENGDCIVIATDGVRGDPLALVTQGAPVGRSAETILTRCASEDDDALVFVARYRSPPGAEPRGAP